MLAARLRGAVGGEVRVGGLAREAGFNEARYVAGTSLAERYFANRTDGLRPSSGEDLLVAAI